MIYSGNDACCFIYFSILTYFISKHLLSKVSISTSTAANIHPYLVSIVTVCIPNPVSSYCSYLIATKHPHPATVNILTLTN